MELAELLNRIARDPDCVVFPPAGQPPIALPHALPQDVRAFYERCGGLVIGRDAFWQARIVGPGECVPATEAILGGDVATAAREEAPEDRSWDWFIIAEIENGKHLAIDLGALHNGRCYDANWETYGEPGEMPVVATSFTELLERLYANGPQHWYWLEPEFASLGDAYDDE